MAVPKRKTSKSRQGLRRSHLAVKAAHSGTCPKCQAEHLPHTICGNCGFYRNGYAINLED